MTPRLSFRFLLLTTLLVCVSAHAQKAAKSLPLPSVRVELTISAQGNCPSDEQFVGPSTVASDSKGNIYMMDIRLLRVWKFDANGKYLTVFGGQGTDEGEFTRPDVMLVTSRDNIVVFDGPLRRVTIFDGSGKLLKTFKVDIRIPFLEMHGTVTPRDEIIIAGYKKGRVLHFYDMNGNLTRSFGDLIKVKREPISPIGHEDFYVPTPLTMANGILYCTDVLEPEILRYDVESGKLLGVTRLQFSHWHIPEIQIMKGGGSKRSTSIRQSISYTSQDTFT